MLDTGVWSKIPQHPLSFVTVSKFQSVLSVEVAKNTFVVPLVYSIHPFMKRQNFMMVCPSSWPRCYVVETETLTLVLSVCYTCMRRLICADDNTNVMKYNYFLFLYC